jgi:hypothetical protein
MALTYGELEILIDGLTDDVAFNWVVAHLGLKMEPNHPPGDRAIDEVFIHVERLVANGLARIGRTEYIDGGTPGRVAPVRLVDEPIALVEDRVRSSCAAASDWGDWAFAFRLVNTDSGDEVAQWALQLAISWAIEERTAVARSDAGHEWRLAELGRGGSHRRHGFQRLRRRVRLGAPPGRGSPVASL